MPGARSNTTSFSWKAPHAYHVGTSMVRQGGRDTFCLQCHPPGRLPGPQYCQRRPGGGGRRLHAERALARHGTSSSTTTRRSITPLPDCTSHELYKAILDGKSRGVFNGKIFVRKDAQKTDAKQTNRTLLLSDDATIDTKPQLEIFADDVKCTHGATVGQLDEEQVFYLRSRGIGEVAARDILTFAFASDVIDRVHVEPLREQLDALLHRPAPCRDAIASDESMNHGTISLDAIDSRILQRRRAAGTISRCCASG